MNWISFLLASTLPAQIFVVDPAGGAGVNFTDIGAAIAAVPDGSILLVHAGLYPAFRVSAKSLTILGEPGVRTTSFAGANEVDGLAAGQQVTIRGVEAFNTVTGSAFYLHDNDGSVLLDACRVGTSSGVGGAIRVVSCVDVQLHECLATAAGCNCFDSALRVSGSELAGFFAGIMATDSSIDLADTTVRAQVPFLYGAIDLANSTARVLAGCALQFVAVGQFVAITGSGSVRLDPSVALPAGAIPFGPTVIGNTIVMPAVAATTGGAGSQASASMTGPAGGIGALFLGLPALPSTPLPGADPFITQIGTENVVALGVFGPALTSSYTVPPLPLLLGVRVAWQGASIDAVNGLQIANGIVYVHY